MEIKDRLLSHNRPGDRFIPRGLVIHSTANPGASARENANYFDQVLPPEKRGSAHLVVDWQEALTLIPWRSRIAEHAWHAGDSANQRFLGMEICETIDPVLFDRVWANAIDAAAQVLTAYRWATDALLTHNQISRAFKETNHTDPIGFFKQHGRSWAQFVLAVGQRLGEAPVRGPLAVVLPNGHRITEGFTEGGKGFVWLRALGAGMLWPVTWDNVTNTATFTEGEADD